MSAAVFNRENMVLSKVRGILEQGGTVNPELFSWFVHEYEKLFRQSRRLVTMGDRMQKSLNNLNKQLTVSEQKYRGIFENVVEGIFRTKGDGELVEVNPAMAAMFDCDNCEDFLKSINSIKTLIKSEKDILAYETTLSETGEVQGLEVEMRIPGGSTLWCVMSARVLRQVDSDVSNFKACGEVTGVITDVTERKRMMEEMCRLARTDGLTGLCNRRYFMELANRELLRERRSGEPLSLLMLDLDHFKRVNDTHGHDVGDQVLKTFSRILLDSVRGVDIVARVGGEEFVVLMPGAGAEEAHNAAERVRRNIAGTIVRAANRAIQVTVSIGITTGPDHAGDVSAMLRQADMALYSAKDKGRDVVVSYLMAS